MRQVFTVFAYTFKEGIRKKAFWVSTGIIMALIVLLCFAPRIITAFEAQESAKKNQAAGEIQTEAGKEGICYFIDETGVFEKIWLPSRQFTRTYCSRQQMSVNWKL